MNFQCDHKNRTGTRCTRRPNYYFYTSNFVFTCGQHLKQDQMKHPEQFEVITKQVYEEKFKKFGNISKQSHVFFVREIERREGFLKNG